MDAQTLRRIITGGTWRKTSCYTAKLILDIAKKFMSARGDQIFFSATCPGQVASKNPLVLRNFLLVPKYFSNCTSFGQVANTTISYSECNSNQTVVDEGSSNL